MDTSWCSHREKHTKYKNTKEYDAVGIDIEITVDGELSEEELPDFLKIKEELEKMALAIDSLNLWIDNTIASGKISKDLITD